MAVEDWLSERSRTAARACSDVSSGCEVMSMERGPDWMGARTRNLWVGVYEYMMAVGEVVYVVRDE